MGHFWVKETYVSEEREGAEGIGEPDIYDHLDEVYRSLRRERRGLSAEDVHVEFARNIVKVGAD